ncbi:MAG TPA: sigma-54 dependent transcriptional regulator [Desulfuromonadales bacterium]|nr:sigma-54 dependent transcriptional regulator [Desulfuromonadales bacterium]
MKILVVDDETVIREGLKRILGEAGYQVETFAQGRLALERMQTENFDLVVSDVKMPGMSGIEVLKAIRVLQPQVPIIMITGYSTVDTAVEALKNGAADYIAKPFTPVHLLEKISQALHQRAILVEDICLQKELQESQGFNGFIGTSREMQKVYHRIIQVAGTDSTVLITGESGTGKELVAQAIHRQGNRRHQAFVALDCTALAENLLESELFGHVKGSFTGAVQSKAGLFKVADGGTLFLDEIANLSLTTQAKLLRVLQERVVMPIGGTQPVSINIRLIAATNRDLRTLVSKGEFREDLFFRLNIIPVDLPPLRERKGDLRLLIGHFLKKFAEETGKEVRGVEPEVIEWLETYPFPGNVRELENIIERAVVLAQGEVISKNDLEMDAEATAPVTYMCGHVPRTADELKTTKQLLRERAVEPIERAFVLDALRRNSWNVTRAAEEVGMLRPNFQAMLKKQGISARLRSDD